MFLCFLSLLLFHVICFLCLSIYPFKFPSLHPQPKPSHPASISSSHFPFSLILHSLSPLPSVPHDHLRRHYHGLNSLFLPLSSHCTASHTCFSPPLFDFLYFFFIFVSFLMSGFFYHHFVYIFPGMLSSKAGYGRGEAANHVFPHSGQKFWGGGLTFPLFRGSLSASVCFPSLPFLSLSYLPSLSVPSLLFPFYSFLSLSFAFLTFFRLPFRSLPFFSLQFSSLPFLSLPFL